MRKGIVFWFISVCESSSHVCIQPYKEMLTVCFISDVVCESTLLEADTLKGWERRLRKSSSVRIQSCLLPPHKVF